MVFFKFYRKRNLYVKWHDAEPFPNSKGKGEQIPQVSENKRLNLLARKTKIQGNRYTQCGRGRPSRKAKNREPHQPAIKKKKQPNSSSVMTHVLNYTHSHGEKHNTQRNEETKHSSRRSTPDSEKGWSAQG